MTLRFLTSFGMTESYVIKEGVGGGFAAAHPLPPNNLLEAPSFRTK